MTIKYDFESIPVLLEGIRFELARLATALENSNNQKNPAKPRDIRDLLAQLDPKQDDQRS